MTTIGLAAAVVSSAMSYIFIAGAVAQALAAKPLREDCTPVFAGLAWPIFAPLALGIRFAARFQAARALPRAVARELDP